MVKSKERFGNIEIEVQDIRITIKTQYHPTPFVWIEKLRPKKGYWQIIAQIVGNKDLADAFFLAYEKIMQQLKKSEVARNV